MFLRRLNLDSAPDHAIASELFLATPGYELETFGRLPSADMAEPLSQRFPAHCAPEHRLTLAAFEHEEPVGLAQVALHAPYDDCALLLLLVVPPHLQQRHVGCEIVERLSRQGRRWPGISRWYISVLESNAGALAFWRHCGFRSLGAGLAVEGFSHRLIPMARPIKGRPVCQHGTAEDPRRVTAGHPAAR